MKQTLMSLLLLGLLSGCGESGSSSAGPDFGGGDNSPPPTSGSDFEQLALISNLTDNVITPVFTNAAASAAELSNQLQSLCTAQAALNGGSGGEQARDDAAALAQTQWLALMAWWQQAELMQIGPLAADNNALRNRIYSWPLVNRCAVDQEVVLFESGEVAGQPYDITLRTDTRKGLDALEYLLFAPSLAHQCPASVAPANWNDRSDDDRRLARCRFAKAASDDLLTNLNALTNQWQSYAAELNRAGQPGSDFSDAQSAVNAISDGLFYIDGFTKDAKLDSPLQQFANSCDDACANALESGLSASSLSNVGNNLSALRRLFTGVDGSGVDGVGFDDYLNEVGSNQLAVQILSDIDQALASQVALGASLVAQLNDDPDAVRQLHSQTKAITDQLKVDFINDLALELPATSAGDND
ncbi:imelysin family protein [Ferrimonas senticii]|uniref:imelysin family protein n=1 Tax=Ferrimonas senticii TaxID=394566 RepID=UPI0003FC4D79|nr:imelysin family protein [Ferrimonas senticii]